MSEHEKVVMIGAGSISFTRGLMHDMIYHKWNCTIALVDIDENALRIIERIVKKMVEKCKASIQVEAHTDRRQALTDASIVICTVGVGGRRAWEQDVFIPRRYGIYQPVGDSVMPGGSSRALRMIHAMIGIARDVEELAPDALFFNYGNPMAPVCSAVNKSVGIPMTGLCHGVFHVANHLAKLLNIDESRLDYDAVGMNHLTWFTKVSIDGQDAMPQLIEKADYYLNTFINDSERGKCFAEAGTSEENDQQFNHPLSWELLKTFKAFPAVLDRHVMEFFPQCFAKEHSYYGQTPGIDAFSFEQCIEWGDKDFERMCSIADSDDDLPDSFITFTGGEHEQVISIINSIRNDDHATYSVNLPNTIQLDNVPQGIILESPAQATKSGLCPQAMGSLDAGIYGTLATRFQWVECIVEAALKGDRDLFVQALIIDGAVTSIDMACNLADDLLAAQAAYLPQFKQRIVEAVS